MLFAANGYRVPVDPSSVRLVPQPQGNRKRAASGAIRDSRRNIVRTWEAKTHNMLPDGAVALRHLLLGEGHFFDCAAGLESLTGLTPTIFRGVVRPLSWGLFGQGVISIGDGVTGAGIACRIPARLPDRWCLIWRAWGASEKAWYTRALLDTGEAWEGGVQMPEHLGADGFTGTLFMHPRVRENGDVDFVTADETPTVVEDIVLLPWRPTAAMLEAWTNPTEKWGPNPWLRATGSLFRNADTFVLVEANIAQHKGMVDDDGVYRADSASLSLRIHELDPHYVKRSQPGLISDSTPSFGEVPLWDFDAGNVDGAHNCYVDLGQHEGDGTRVTIWVDLGSRAANARASNVATSTGPILCLRPRKKGAGGYDAPQISTVLFDVAAERRLKTNAGAASAGAHTFLVAWVSDDAAAASRAIMDGLDGNGVAILHPNTATTGTIRSTRNTAIVGPSRTRHRWEVALVVFNAASSSLRVRGTTYTGGSSGRDSMTGLTIGGLESANQFVGQLAEIKGWAGTPGSGAPSLADFEAYALERYGVTL